MRYAWKIGGPAGYGIKSAGEIFAKTFAKKGLFSFYYSEYPSLIRGGHNTVQVDISDKKIRSASEKISFLAALDETTIEKDRQGLSKKGILVFDEAVISNKRKLPRRNAYHVPLKKLADETGGAIMINTVAIGASLAFFGTDLKESKEVIRSSFSDKEPEIIKQNIKALEAGFDYVRENYQPVLFDGLKESEKKLLLTGNEATAMGAAVGGLQFFAAYPMTPSTAILHYLIQKQRDLSIVVHQGEDEIGVIHEALGASFAGARSMVTTSGGGFALMNEGLSLAGMTETPLVIVEVMRPAPATGLPTWSDQGDLAFALNAGHGDFPRLVISPGDPEECYELIQQALNFSEKYQLPVIILSDKFLGESKYPLEKNDLKTIKVKREERGILDKSFRDYRRYLNTKTGVSLRVLPGTEGGAHLSNSDEHNERGFSVEGFDKDRKIQMEKRMRKLEFLTKELPAPQIYGPQKAQLSLISWGSNKGPILDALEEINYQISRRLEVNYIHFNYLYPLPRQANRILTRAQRLFLIENNFSAQFGKLLRQELGIEIKHKLLKYDGKPFWPEEIIRALRAYPIGKIGKLLWRKKN